MVLHCAALKATAAVRNPVATQRPIQHAVLHAGTLHARKQQLSCLLYGRATT